MIPKILLQTSKNKPDKYTLDSIDSIIDESWTYIHFVDSEIVEYFNNNKLEEFPDIIEIFNSIEQGEYKADMFRYYYLYINGGVFVDSDLELSKPLDKIIKKYNFFTVQSGSEKNHESIFNGLLGTEANNKIIYEALVDIYNTFKNKKPINDYEYFCVNLCDIYNKYKNLYTTKIFAESELGSYSLIYDPDTFIRIAVHYHLDGYVNPFERRIQKITDLYKLLLQRNPDKLGLRTYVNSNLSIDEIKNKLLNSDEIKSIFHNYYKSTQSADVSYTKYELFNNQKTRIDYFKQKVTPNSKKIAVTCRGVAEDLSLNDMGIWGKKLLEDGYDVIAFKSHCLEFYSDVDIEVYDKISNILNNYDTKLGVGISMGCYPLINFSKLFKLKKCFLFGARIKEIVDEKIVWMEKLDTNTIDKDTHFSFLMNPNNLLDVDEMKYILNKLPSNNYEIYHIIDDGFIHVPLFTLYGYSKSLYDEFVDLLVKEQRILNHTIIRKI